MESNRIAGYLTRRARYLQTWQVRYFVLDGDYSSTLSYFEDKTERNKRGTIEITADSTINYLAEKDGYRHVIQLITADLRFYASAENKEECETWVAAIQRAIDVKKTRKVLENNHFSSRPPLARVLNALCSIPQALQISYWGQPNDIRTAIKMGKSQTGLSNFGFGGDEKMVECYETSRKLGLQRSEATYTPLGYYFVLDSLTSRVRDRLNLVDYMSRHPQIASVPLVAPVFVIGFPRTGTTFLHELLGLHPRVCMHYTWEQFDPVPSTHDDAPEAHTREREQRYEKNKSRFQTFLSLGGDDIQSIHRIGYDEPEECTTPCGLELPWNIPEIPFTVFAEREVMELGAGQAFTIYRNYLQLLTWQSAERRKGDLTWMLKCPFHLPYLSDLHHSFPDSTIVWTHRDPAECIASACSLYDTIMQWTMEPASINRIALGRATLQYTRCALDRALETLDRLGDTQKIIHVRYADNIKSPKDICRLVAETSGLGFTPEYEELLDGYLQRNAEQRAKLKASQGGGNAPLHQYSLEDYGLTREVVDEHFKDYTTRFRLMKDKKATSATPTPVAAPAAAAADDDGGGETVHV